MILAACLLLWIALGLITGELLMDCAMNVLDETDALDSNYSLALVVFTIAAVISLPWLICCAICQSITNIFRR